MKQDTYSFVGYHEKASFLMILRYVTTTKAMLPAILYKRKPKNVVITFSSNTGLISCNIFQSGHSGSTQLLDFPHCRTEISNTRQECKIFDTKYWVQIYHFCISALISIHFSGLLYPRSKGRLVIDFAEEITY